MTWHSDVIMTLFNISGTICPNYVVFVLNPMFSGSRISKKTKPSSSRCTVTSWRDTVTLNNGVMMLVCPVMTSRYTPRWRLCFFRDPWPRKHRIQHKNHVIRAISSRDVEQCHDDVTVFRHDVTVHVTMTALIFSKYLTPKTQDSKQKRRNSCN